MLDAGIAVPVRLCHRSTDNTRSTCASVPPSAFKYKLRLPRPHPHSFRFIRKRRMQLMADEEDEAVRQEADQIRSKIAVLTRNAARLEALAFASPSPDTGGKGSIFHYASYMSTKIFPTVPLTGIARNCTAATPLLFMHLTPPGVTSTLPY